MYKEKTKIAEWGLAVAAVVCLVYGLGTANWLLAGLAAAMVVYVAIRPLLALLRQFNSGATKEVYVHQPRPRATDNPDATSLDLIDEMLAQGRYALLLRPQIAQNLSHEQLEKAVGALDDHMGLVPDGVVVLSQPNLQDNTKLDAAVTGKAIRVEAMLLDRHPVTNQQYQEFVDAGGYQEMALWDREILAGVLDFVDRSGEPGPRFWENGIHAPELAGHPVVGVTWYEAAAYARWAGKRLPSDAEWVKAASWPVPVPGNTPLQRRFPWGETMNHEATNLWVSGRGGTVPVNEFKDGVSVGGLYNLIGNVWEWTSTEFGRWHDRQLGIETNVAMRSIRGGAFDTYFENHATCQFQSGDTPVTRARNIGFRCALGICDMAPIPTVNPQDVGQEIADDDTQQTTQTMESNA